MVEPGEEAVHLNLVKDRRGVGGCRAERSDTAGVSKSYLSNLETEAGHEKPSGESLHAIAKALNTTMSALLGKRLLTTDKRKSTTPSASLAEPNSGKPNSKMLASIKWRGEPSRTLERWQFVYDALKASTTLDQKGH
jgi:transcriptional regulator with XRE-family HTH domain